MDDPKTTPLGQAWVSRVTDASGEDVPVIGGGTNSVPPASAVDLDTLIAKWRASRAHTYASENADLYRGFDNGCQRCADELEAALRALRARERPQPAAVPGYITRSRSR